MTDDSMFGRGAAKAPYPQWSRPNPPRLNDTSALVRKGTYPWELETRLGFKSECEMPFNAENTFAKNPPQAGFCGPYGAGAVVAVRTPYKSKNGRTADGNGTVPSRGNSLAVGIQEIKS